ncbi:MAG: hypothetical protein CMK06_01055 [Ponticaulis sp.]|nr:hypothetical protein [Ponticaulis sp.]|tara:strand:- start:3787 stop:4218 length:432 start_codon:yes stop_codon:yes gene_type:complete
MIRLFTTAACLTLATPVAVAAPANFTPGLWETSITFSVLEQSNTDATTDCMGPEEAQTELSSLASEFATGMGCTAQNLKEGDNTVSFSMSCTPDSVFNAGNAVMTKVSDTNFSIEGDLSLTLPNQQDAVGKLRTNSRRVGACS